MGTGMKKRPGTRFVLFLAFLLIFPGIASLLSPEKAGDYRSTENGILAAGDSGRGSTNGAHDGDTRSSIRQAGHAGGRGVTPTMPDLILTGLNWSLTVPDDGVSTTIFATVFNDGTDIGRPFSVDIYTDGESAGSAIINGLPGGSFTTVRVGWTASPGTHEIMAVTDQSNDIKEANETNNFRTAYIDIPYPDLVIQDLSWYPKDFRDGDQLSVTATIKNSGPGGTTRPIVLEAFVDQSPLANEIVAGLGANSTAQTTFQWTATAGDHTLFVDVDPANMVCELTKTNNRMMVQIGEDFPNLVVANLTMFPLNPTDGGPVVFSSTVTNWGPGNTTARFPVGFYIDGELAASDTVFGLGANSSRNVSVGWTALPGHHTLRAVADMDNIVDEAVENDNHRLLSFDVPYPALSVRDILWEPALPTDGRQVRVNVTISNSGAGATLRAIPVDIFIDGEAVGSAMADGLEGGGLKNVSANWTATPGDHELRAVVDPGNVIVESDEGNNYLVKQISVPYPDIALSNLTFTPQVPDPGVPVTLRTVLSNIGPGNTSRAFEVRFFAGGEQVGSATIAGLNRGAPEPLSAVWTARSGTFDLSAVADARGDIGELDELNNVVLSRISVPFPDLKVVGVTASPPGAVAGDMLNVSVVISNEGANESASFSVGLYANDVLARSTFVAGTTTGQNLTANFTITLPSNITTLRGEADFEHALPELSEANNNLTVLYPNGTVVLPAPMPDLTIREVRWLPENPVDGETVTLLATVDMAGAANVDPLDVYTGFIIDGQTLASVKVRILGGEGVARYDAHLAPGNHSIEVMADTQWLVTETRKDNNWAFASVEILPSDIAIISFAPTQPVAVDGDTVTVFSGMVNRGPGSTQADFGVDFFVDGILTRSQVQKGLPVGANNTVMFSFIASPGVHRLKVEANSARRLVETDFTNGEAISQVRVDRADLSVSSLQAPPSAEQGAPVSISATVSNLGATTVRDFQVSLFADGLQVGKFTISGLPAGKSATVIGGWTAQAGSHLIMARSDSASVVSESNETNNWMSVTAVNVSLPDLRMGGLNVVAPPVDGAESLVSANLSNAGDTTVRDVMVAFYIDEMQVKSLHLGGVLAGASFTVSERFKLAAGPHLLKVAADPAGTVPELDETNNAASLSFNGTGYPDLTLTGLKVPPTAVDGDTASVFAEVENSGGATADAFTVSFFIDGLRVADGLVEGLPSGGTAAVSAHWTALPGAHYVRAVVDPADLISEVDETNNGMHSKGLNTEQPDMAVSDISCVRGLDRTDPDTFRVFATLDNIGGPTLRDIHATVYIDDRSAGDLLVQGLPARSSTQASVSARAASPHSITIRADELGTLFEGDESNNEASVPFAPVDEIPDTFADLIVKDITVAPTAPTDGETVDVFASVSNDGNASLMGDADTILTANGQNVSKATLHGLTPGAEAMLSFRWTASAGTTRFGLLIIPSGSAQGIKTESGDINTTVNILTPDLRVVGLVRQNTIAGLTADMFAVIDNNGTGDTVRTFNVNIYIGGLLYAQKSINGLLSGETLCLGFEWQSVSGETDIVVWADPNEKVSESDEGNNRFHDLVYTNYPDFVVGNITWSAHWASESTVTFFAELVNDGATSGGTVSVSLSVDSNILGIEAVYGMPAGSKTVLSWRWTVQPGNHSLSAVADIYDNVLESDENNDKQVIEFPSGAVTYFPTPTNLLAATAGFTQSRDVSGNLISLSFTITNDGLENISSCFASVLVDGLVLTELLVPQIGANSTYDLTYNWSTGVSDHTVKIIVDDRRQVAEDIESDNDQALNIVANIPPIVDPGGPYKAYFGDTVTLRGSGHDPDGYVALYEWDLNGDGLFNGSADARSTTSGQLTKLFHKAGLFKVGLRVTDDQGATSVSTTTVWIKEKPKQELIKMDVLTAVLLVIVIAICATVAVMLYRGRGEVFRS